MRYSVKGMLGTYKIKAAFSPSANAAKQGYNVDIGYRGMYVFKPDNVLWKIIKSDDPHKDRKKAHDSLPGVGKWIEDGSVTTLLKLWDAKPEERYKLLNTGKLTPF